MSDAVLLFYCTLVGYVASGITRMGITELTVAVWPWLLTMLVFLVIVTYWPAMTLALPKALGML